MDPTLEDAIIVATVAHRDQSYPAPRPEPYILHPLRVMLEVRSLTAKIVAVLHDVVEDSDVRLEDLQRQGFVSAVLEAVDCLSRRTGEGYEEYIRRLSSNDVAREVKLADLRDNLANNRSLPAQPDRLARIAKYERARQVLLSTLSTPPQNAT